MTDRRQVLQMAVLAVGAMALPACTGSADEITQPDASPDPAQATELALIAAYDAALTTAGPKAAAVYQRIRDEHAAHLTALGWQAGPNPSTSPAARRSNRAALLRAERAAARQHTVGARDTTDPDTAQILALIAASEAQHMIDLERL